MAKTTHFCMGHAMKSEIGFSQKHLDCGMNMPMDHSENEDDNQKDPKSCCENITEQLQVDDDVELKKADLKLNLNFSVSLIHVFIFGLDLIDTDQSTFTFYLSPPLNQDIHVLFEQFLI